MGLIQTVWNKVCSVCTALGPAAPIATVAIGIWANRKIVKLQEESTESTLATNQQTLLNGYKDSQTKDMAQVSVALSSAQNGCILAGYDPTTPEGRDYMATQAKKLFRAPEDMTTEERMDYWVDVVMGRK